MDVLKAYRAEAEKQHKGYQTLMLETLRDALPYLGKKTIRAKVNRDGFLAASDLNSVFVNREKFEELEELVKTMKKDPPKLKRA